MTGWAIFFATVAIVTVLAVGFATLTARAIHARVAKTPPGRRFDPVALLDMSRSTLYVNAAVSQGVLLLVLVGGLVLASVDSGHLGLGGSMVSLGSVVLGLGVGVVLAAANGAMQRAFDRAGVPYDDTLRRLLTPTGPVEWALLLLVVLPIVATFEELLFRAALIGGLAAGTGLSPWLFVPFAAVVFALGHGLQGRGGLLAAAILGFLLGGAFVATERLLVVIIAHYLVNAIEFARH